MIRNSVLGILLTLTVFSSLMIILWAMTADDSQKKYEQLTQAIVTNANSLCFGERDDAICTSDGWLETEKRGFLTDKQIYKFISDCHQLKGNLNFDRIYSDRGVFYDLRCNE